MIASETYAANSQGIAVAEYVRMSTDHQKYSIANQSALTHAYASAHGMQIVRTYADPGKSGLSIRGRPGLSLLLADVVAGSAPFRAVLVYDMSRWGRFQDVDESAHYEFICKQAGIRVVYCAEQFAGEGTPFGSVMKALKRAMAGEFSRELSVKVATGKARIGALGYRVGGIAGFGFRRQLLEGGTTPGITLTSGQRKAIQTDRITLVPGPPEELAVIRRIYRDYVYLRKSERQIADDLNDEGLTCFGRAWSRNLVRAILSNEKYLGNNIVGRFCTRLCTKQIINPPEDWTRCNGAFQALVDRDLFHAAAKVRRFNEKTYISESEILQGLATVLRREGKLSAKVIDGAPELPSANTVEQRFGSLGQAYERLGYLPLPRYRHHAVDRALKDLRREQERGLLRALSAHADGVSIDERGLLAVPGRCTVELLVSRHQQRRPTQAPWRCSFQRNLGADLLVAARMDSANQRVIDFLLIPRAEIGQLPLWLGPSQERLLEAYTHSSLASVAAKVFAYR